MPASEHHGVIAIVTNADRSRFVVQRKDAAYPRYPRGYSFFGGAREPGESVDAALARELTEELGATEASRLLAFPRTRLHPDWIAPTGFVLTRFELVVDDATLEHLATVPIHEGERAELVDRPTLLRLPWAWQLDTMLTTYLQSLG